MTLLQLGDRVDISRAESMFRERLRGMSTPTVRELLDAMIDFYREVRFDTAPLDEDGDGLLLQWGTYDWGQGSHFELDMTRQFIIPGVEEPIQLNMTMRFEPTAALAALGASERWCFSLGGIGEFEEFLRSSSPYLALKFSEPSALDVRFGQV